jgi:glutamate racemase
MSGAAHGSARRGAEQTAASNWLTGRGPIGVFDSGVGGLTILSELWRVLPDERFVYFGDTGNCPYGVRPETEIQELSLAAARLLLGRGAKMIVVACNTASVSAVHQLRAALSDQAPFVHFVVVVPAVKPAAKRTQVGRVGIAATEVSARGGYLQRLIDEFANGVEVYPIGCPRLVELVERGVLDGPEAEAAVRADIQPLLDAGIDKLVLGCTHFPALRAVFERVAGPEIEVIDSGEAIARQTRRMLTQKGLLAPPRAKSMAGATAPRRPWMRDEFWCSGAVEHFEEVASAIIAAPVAARYAPAMLVPATPIASIPVAATPVPAM